MKPKKTASKKPASVMPEASKPSPKAVTTSRQKANAPTPAETKPAKAPAKKKAVKVVEKLEKPAAAPKSPALKAAPTKPKAAAKPKAAKKVSTKAAQATAPSEPALVKAAPEVPAAPAPTPLPATKAAKKSAKAPVKLPAILFEDDAMPTPSISGPGQRYFLGADEPATGLGELPEAYGTGRVIIAARDPHWLYVAWDLTRDQQRAYNALSKDKHLVVRVFVNKFGGKPFSETHVHPESRHWFIHAGKAGVRFLAELGYYDKAGKWVMISQSKTTLTPPDSLSADTSVRFTEIPVEVPFQTLIETVKEELKENLPLVEALEQLRASGEITLPSLKSVAKGNWTPKQEAALAAIVSMDSVRRIWIGSLEITELIKRKLTNELASAAAAEFSKPEAAGLGSLGSVSSPFGGAPENKGFWFNINAELIIYGATEPTAEVTIGGKVIKLRPDGTFSYRFALPDGNYDLPAVAISADRSEARHAELKFSRSTQYHGDVGKHPQDPSLQPPTPDAVE